MLKKLVSLLFEEEEEVIEEELSVKEKPVKAEKTPVIKEPHTAKAHKKESKEHSKDIVAPKLPIQEPVATVAAQPAARALRTCAAVVAGG